MDNNYTALENKDAKSILHKRNKYMGLLSPVGAIANHYTKSGKERSRLIAKSEHTKLTESEMKQLRKLNHVRTNTAIGNLGGYVVPVVGNIVGAKILRNEVHKRSADNYSEEDNYAIDWKDVKSNARADLKGAAIGAVAGYGAHLITSRKSRKRFNELKIKNNLSKEELLEFENLKKSLWHSKYGLPTAGVAMGMGVSGLIKEYKEDNNSDEDRYTAGSPGASGVGSMGGNTNRGLKPLPKGAEERAKAYVIKQLNK